jgi:hypothetical protein
MEGGREGARGDGERERERKREKERERERERESEGEKERGKMEWRKKEIHRDSETVSQRQDG